MDNNNFFAIDKLVEFGMSLAIAKQMVDVMNQTINDMHIPGSIQSMPSPIISSIFVAINGKQIGPISPNELISLINKGDVNKDSLVWVAGMSGWKPIEEVPEILKLIALSPPPLNL